MPKNPVEFVAECTFNKLFLIQSLEDGELKTGTRLALDSLTPMCRELGFGLTAYDVRSKAQFLKALNTILTDSSNPEKPIYPILHFEIHGARDKSGLMLSPSGEIVAWAEFAAECRRINTACKNNLFVVMAVCYGYQSILAVDIKDVTPFCLLIGPERTVTAGYIEDRFPQFYATLIRQNDIDAAMLHLIDEYRMYLCERLFFRAFFKYTKEQCVGEGKQKRIEDLIERLQTNLGGELPNPEDVRKQLESVIKPDPDAFARFKARFLMSDHTDNANRFPVRFDYLLQIL